MERMNRVKSKIRIDIRVGKSFIALYRYSILHGLRPIFAASSSVTLRIFVEQLDSPLHSFDL